MNDSTTDPNSMEHATDSQTDDSSQDTASTENATDATSTDSPPATTDPATVSTDPPKTDEGSPLRESRARETTDEELPTLRRIGWKLMEARAARVKANNAKAALAAAPTGTAIDKLQKLQSADIEAANRADQSRYDAIDAVSNYVANGSL